MEEETEKVPAKKLKLQQIGHYKLDGKVLGKGNFARVELAWHTLLGEKVAVKIVDTETISQEYVMKHLEREGCVLGQLNHPNVVQLYETLRSGVLHCLVLEYVAGGDLMAYIRNQPDRRLTEIKARSVLRELAGAIRHVHGQGILHRDLKLENVLLDEHKHVKLVDFGLSTFYDGTLALRTHCGSPEYAAPELFMPEAEYDASIDLWSMGIILFAMVIGTLPFTHHRSEGETLHDKRRKLLTKVTRGLSKSHETSMEPLTEECRNLIRSLLQTNQKKRMTLDELFCHPWLNETTWHGRLLFNRPPTPKQLKDTVVEHMAIILSRSTQDVKRKIARRDFGPICALYKIMVTKLSKDDSGCPETKNPNPKTSWKMIKEAKMKEQTDKFAEYKVKKNSSDIYRISKQIEIMDLSGDAEVSASKAKKSAKFNAQGLPSLLNSDMKERASEFLPRTHASSSHKATQKDEASDNDDTASRTKADKSRPHKTPPAEISLLENSPFPSPLCLNKTPVQVLGHREFNPFHTPSVSDDSSSQEGFKKWSCFNTAGRPSERSGGGDMSSSSPQKFPFKMRKNLLHPGSYGDIGQKEQSRRTKHKPFINLLSSGIPVFRKHLPPGRTGRRPETAEGGVHKPRETTQPKKQPPIAATTASKSPLICHIYERTSSMFERKFL